MVTRLCYKKIKRSWTFVIHAIHKETRSDKYLSKLDEISGNTHLRIADFISGSPDLPFARSTPASTLLSRYSAAARPKRASKFISKLSIMTFLNVFSAGCLSQACLFNKLFIIKARWNRQEFNCISPLRAVATQLVNSIYYFTLISWAIFIRWKLRYLNKYKLAWLGNAKYIRTFK